VNVPAGSQVLCRFYFSHRELTVAEDEKFFDPDRVTFPGLPLGVAYKPPGVLFEYRKGSGAWVTLEGVVDVVEDAEGEYHSIVTAPLNGVAVWSYRGRAVDGATVIASTFIRTFTVS
jgi:hypothetical protein